VENRSAFDLKLLQRINLSYRSRTCFRFVFISLAVHINNKLCVADLLCILLRKVQRSPSFLADMLASGNNKSRYYLLFSLGAA